MIWLLYALQAVKLCTFLQQSKVVHFIAIFSITIIERRFRHCDKCLGSDCRATHNTIFALFSSKVHARAHAHKFEAQWWSVSGNKLLRSHFWFITVHKKTISFCLNFAVYTIHLGTKAFAICLTLLIPPYPLSSVSSRSYNNYNIDGVF